MAGNFPSSQANWRWGMQNRLLVSIPKIKKSGIYPGCKVMVRYPLSHKHNRNACFQRGYACYDSLNGGIRSAGIQ